MTPIWQVFWVAVLTAGATGLGVIPLLFIRDAEVRWQSIAAAAAGGMMLSASVFALADEALQRGRAIDVIVGMILGAAFFAYTARIVEHRGWGLRGFSDGQGRQSILLVITLFVHSVKTSAEVPLTLRVRWYTGRTGAGVSATPASSAFEPGATVASSPPPAACAVTAYQRVAAVAGVATNRPCVGASAGPPESVANA